MYFKFCPVCGKKALKQETKNLIKCQSCSFEWYQNPKPASNCICLAPDYKILLTKRAFQPKKDKWGTPGGFVDAGDNLELAAIREMKEELDLELTPDRLTYLNSNQDKYNYQGCEYNTMGVLFEVKLSQQEINNLKPQDDVSQIRFFDIDKIPWNELAFESTKKSLQNYLEIKALNPNSLLDLRQKIDQTDQDILISLARRKEIVKLIGKYKKAYNLPVLDKNRWQKVKQKVISTARQLDLDPNLILNFWEDLHQYAKNIEKQV